METQSFDSISTGHRKGVVTTGWCALAVSTLLIAVEGHASSFEISIYEGVPISVWILLILAIVAGVVVLLSSPSPTDNRICWLAITLLVSVNVLVLLLPALRGYPLYGRGDTLRHLGEMRYILQSGQVDKLNFYPLTHLVGSTIVSVTNIPLHTTSYVLWTMFYMLYALGLLLVYRSIFDDHHLAFVFSVPLVHVFFHPVVQPAFYTFFFIPMMLFLIKFRENLATMRHRLLLVVLIIALIAAHPIALPVMLILVFSPKITKVIASNLTKLSSEYLSTSVLIVLVIIPFVAWAAWYSHYFPIVGVFIDMVNRIMYLVTSDPAFLSNTAIADNTSSQSSGNSTNVIISALRLLAEKGFTLRQTVVMVTFRFGHIVLYYLALGSALVAGTAATRRFWLKRRTYEVGAQLGLAGLVGLAFVLLPLALGTFTRVIRWSVFFLLIALPSVILDFEEVIGDRDTLVRVLRVCVAVLVILAATFAMFGAYRAPQNGKVNPQITEKKLSGTEWFQDYRNQDLIMIYSTADIWKLGQFYGYNIRNTMYEKPIPPRFGYESGSLSSMITSQNKYVITTEMDRRFQYAYPVNVRPSLVKRYLSSDFKRLQAEPTVDRVYDNGGYTVRASLNSGQ